MKLIDRLRKRCQAAGLELPEGVQIRRTHAGRHQLACGAWKWFLITADGHIYSPNLKGQVGSQFRASDLVKHELEVSSDQPWGDINLDPKETKMTEVTGPQWKLLSNSKKAHLFVGGRSLCNKFMYLGKDHDGPWKGTGNSGDCAACVKAAIKNYPRKEKEVCKPS